MLEDAITLTRRKIEGKASQEHALADKSYADAVKAAAEAEDLKIDTELKRRALNSQVTKQEAEADKAKADAKKAIADARVAETGAVTAEVELLEKLQHLGVIIEFDESGQMKICQLPAGVNLLQTRLPLKLRQRVDSDSSGADFTR